MTWYSMLVTLIALLGAAITALGVKLWFKENRSEYLEWQLRGGRSLPTRDQVR
jgi:hypothetical protein